MGRFILNLAMVLVCAPMCAQVTTELVTTLPEVPSAGGTTSGYPINTYWHDLRYETIYLASELTAAGLTPNATITAMHLKCSQIPGRPTYANHRIRVQHTTLTTIPATFTPGGWTLCHGPVSTPQASFVPTNWFVCPFSTPFVWDGTSNLMVDFTTDDVDYLSGGGSYMRTTTTARSHSAYDDSINTWPYDNATMDRANLFEVPSLRLEYIPGGPALTVAAVAGTAQQATAADLGVGGNGIMAGTFTISSSAQAGANMQGIRIQGLGTGDDQTAYSQVAIYRDINSNNTFEFGFDTQIASVTSFPSNDGMITFPVVGAEQLWNVSETRRYFIVVKMGGAVPAVNAQTFNYRVDGVMVPGSVVVIGAGPTSTVMNGLIIVGPTLGAGALAGSAQVFTTTETGPGSNGVAVGTFTITNNAAGTSNLASITVEAQGTGNDQTVYSQVALYDDSNLNSTWEFGTDPLYGTAAVAFPADNGTLVFNSAQVFAISQIRRYFVVVKLNGAQPGLNGQTLNFRISALGAGAGTAVTGTPTATMNGIVISGPQLTAAPNVGAAQSVLTTEQGTGNAGIMGGWFTLTATAFATTVNSISIQAQGTGNDLTAYTSIKLFRDVNNDSLFDAGDAQYGLEALNFGGDDGTVVFTSAFPFAASQTTRFLIVVKFAGTPALNGATFNYRVADIAVPAGTNKVVPSTTTINGFTIRGPVIAVAPTAGAAQPVLATALGTGNNGISAGTFTVINNTLNTSGTVNTVVITSLGTGNGLTAYSSVQLFEDTNTNSTWDFGTDAQVGGTLTSFTAANGTATFALSAGAQQTFTVGASPMTAKRYFIVVKLNGSTPAAVGATFNYQVTGMTVGTNTTLPALPVATIMNGLVISAPTFNVTDNPLPQVTAYRSTPGYVLQSTTISYPAGPTNSLSSLTIGASGSGNDVADYSGLRLYLDNPTTGTVGSYDAGDALMGTLPAFQTDNGTAQFNLSAPNNQFTAGASKRFFVVGDFGNTALNNTTFQTRLAAAAVTYTGTTFTPALPMTGYTAGAVVVLPPFIFTDNSGQNQTNAFLGDSGFVLQKFTVSYPSGPANVLGTISLTASGTGNDLQDYAAVHLYADDTLAGTVGDFDAADLLVNTQPAFSADNGQLTFNLTGPASMFATAETKQYFVVVDFNQAGINATTFTCAVTAAGATNFGSPANGLPQGPGPGLNLLDANLWAFFNGPGFATSVNSNSQGVNDEGLLLCDVTLATGPGSGWQINELTFTGTGTADHATAYADLWLYEDDGNGAWDGPAIDTPAAAPLASFAPGTFAATFQILNTATGLNNNRRFFLLGRLSGMATSGQTLNARLDGVTGVPNVGGSVRGLPLVNSTALIIESTVLTVLGGPNMAPDLLRKAGAAFVHPIMNLRMAASNNSVTVNGITFSNTGNVSASLSATGFQVWLDDGDGAFTAGDSVLFQGAGAGAVNAAFSTPVVVQNSGTRDLWVVMDVLATAGAGAALAQNYQTVINAPTDVSVAGGFTVLMGTPAPQSNVMRLVDFFVSNFDPVADLPQGGKDITITGSGFMSPIVVAIDGVVCPGVPVIVSGTQVTGIQVPPGSGLDRTITIKSGQLDVETLVDTFDYVPLQPPKATTSSDCSAAPGVVSLWPVLAAIAPLALRLRRRK